MTSAVAHFERYAGRLSSLMAALDWSAVAPLAMELADCAQSRRHVFICGNGGSASNACHLGNDLVTSSAETPGQGVRASALTANPAVLTCLANDMGYERIFELQLRELADPGDVLIVYSGSGESLSIVRALEAAREIGMRSYAVLGYSGGRCKALADHAIHVPVDDMQMAEDMQLVIGHMLTQWLRESRAAPSRARGDRSGDRSAA